MTWLCVEKMISYSLVCGLGQSNVSGFVCLISNSACVQERYAFVTIHRVSPSTKHKQNSVECVYVYMCIYLYFFFPLAQISAEEIKDTRVVYLEIEARNLDKKVLIDLFLMILHASVGFASKKAVTVKIVSLTVL